MSSLRFGPEWMRKPSRTHLQPSPEPITASNGSPAPPGASYAALASHPSAITPLKHDGAFPYRYTKEELLHIYKEGGGRGGLPLEVDRWDGVTHEIGSEPISIREMTEDEKKVRVHRATKVSRHHSHEAFPV
jgi:PERQ amino acid-rich with GYF domain-containing protein